MSTFDLNVTAELEANPTVGRWRRWLDGLYFGCAYAAGFCLVAVFTIMIGGSIAREVGLPTRGTNDIVAWFSAGAAFLGLAHTFKHGDMVRVGIVIESVPWAVRRLLELLALAISAAFCCYMTWWAGRGVVDSFQFGHLAEGLIAMPMWIPQSTFLIGSSVLSIAMLDELVIVATGGRPTYALAVEARHAAGDFSSEI